MRDDFESPRVQWEYLVFCQTTPGKAQEYLNELGKDGWELVAVYDTRVYLKRPIDGVIEEETGK